MSQEQTIWKGHPAFIVNLPMDILAIIFVGIIFYFNLPLFVLILPLVFILWNFLTTNTTIYHLTTERLKSSYGVFNKRIDELELYRVKDYRIEQPFVLRIFSLGNIILDTSDKSNPMIILRAVPDSEKLLNSIRINVEERRKLKSIREVDIN